MIYNPTKQICSQLTCNQKISEDCFTSIHMQLFNKGRYIVVIHYFEMGHNGSRVIQIKNVEEHLNQCETTGRKKCPIYGQLQCVRYKGMDFNIAESQTCDTPHPMSIHYLVLPSYLLFPDFTLLEDLTPSSLNDLLSMITGICEMSIEGGPVGIGHNRLAYKDRWGVVGELTSDWVYRQVWEEGITEGVFFSPQQMIAFSQGRASPRYDASKADVFALGIMLVEIIFQELLGFIYDYENFEIKLNPLLEKLQRIKEEFGEQVASLFVGMLEIEEEDRYTFQEILDIVSQLLAPPPARPSGLQMLNSNGSQRALDVSKGRSAAGGYCRTPKQADRGTYRNDVSPFRGRFGGAVKTNVGTDRPRKTPERAHESRSPMRRQNMPQKQDFQSLQRVSPLGRR